MWKPNARFGISSAFNLYYYTNQPQALTSTLYETRMVC